jgi:1,4-alpha-glucan branching enzyme
MSISIRADDSEDVVVRFRLPAGSASVVSVVGSFNDWTPGVHELAAADDGSRSVSVTVPAGRDVHFRYLDSDGHWFDDPDADEVDDNGGRLRLSMHTGASRDKGEDDVQADDHVAWARDTGGVANPGADDQASTTGTSVTAEYVGRIAGDDVGYADETGAERRAAAEQPR